MQYWLGLYRADGITGCYWERLSDVSGRFDVLLADDNASGQPYAKILPTDVASSTDDCRMWSCID